MPAPLTLARGQVLRAHFPFSETSGGKNRRCMVLGWSAATDDPQVLLVPITTHSGDPSRATADDVALDNEPDADVSPGSFLQVTHFAALKITALVVKESHGRLRKETVAQAIVALQRMATTTDQLPIRR